MMSHTVWAKFLLFVMLLLGTAAEGFAADGELDASFDGDGIVVTDLGTSFESIAEMAVQPDGKIVVAGYTTTGIVVARYNPDGGLDATFGTGGTTTIPAAFPSSLALQPDGKIVVGGSKVVGSTGETPINDFFVARLNSDGGLDTSFNGVGTLVLDLRGGQNDIAASVKIQPDGKIVVGGTSEQSLFGPRDYAIVRLQPNGMLDTSFDGDGKVFTVITTGGSPNFFGKLAIQADGKILATGSAYFSPQENAGVVDYAMVTVRYLPNGTLDASFDGDGKVYTQQPSQSSFANAITTQTDGKIIVAGRSRFTGQSDQAFMVRYNPDGMLDTSFGTGGRALISAGTATDVEVQSDKKIILAIAFDFNQGNDLGSYGYVGRLNTNGTLDTFFSNDGVSGLPFAMPTRHRSNAVALQPNGKILIGGSLSVGTNEPRDFMLARFENTGCPSNCFKRVADFDGDGRTDLSFFRQETWYVKPSGASDQNSFYGTPFGTSTDRLAPADFDGDGRTDIAVFRNGIWYLQRSQLGFTSIQFGTTGDIPLPADYDGDGLADVAVFRHGTWYILGSQVGFYGVQFGVSIDRPVPADFDGDGKTDPAVFRDGIWYQLRSQEGFTAVHMGVATDRPVVGYYDEDNRADPAVFRAGVWYILSSTQGFSAVQFGLSSDTPVPGDYDGDGRTDIAVNRNGTWYQQRSQQGFTSGTFGTTNDVPIPSVYVPWGVQAPW